jgi:hypothetical protein
VYFEDNIKYALYGLARAQTAARWLLSDLCRREALTKRKSGAPLYPQPGRVFITASTCAISSRSGKILRA